MLQLIEDSPTTDATDNLHGNSIFQQSLGLTSNRKAEALFKTHSPEGTRRIFDKAEIMQDPNRTIFQIALTIEKIEDLAEFRAIQNHRQGIN